MGNITKRLTPSGGPWGSGMGRTRFLRPSRVRRRIAMLASGPLDVRCMYTRPGWLKASLPLVDTCARTAEDMVVLRRA